MNDKENFVYKHRKLVGIYLLWFLFHLGAFCYQEGPYDKLRYSVPRLFFFLVFPIVLVLAIKLLVKKSGINSVKMHLKTILHGSLAFFKKYGLLIIVLFLGGITLISFAYISGMWKPERTETNHIVSNLENEIYMAVKADDIPDNPEVIDGIKSGEYSLQEVKEKYTALKNKNK